MDSKTRVLMVGPDRSVHGGISAVVNEFYKAGIEEKVDLKYIGTMKEGSKLKKFFVAAFAFARFLFSLPACDVVHVHFSSDMSFKRKSYYIHAAHFFGKRIILHQHGGDFKTYYGQELSDRGRAWVKRILEMGEVMLVLTPSWKDFFSQIIDADKIEVFPNGVRVDKKKALGIVDSKDVVCAEDSGSESDQRLLLRKDYNKVLFLGRVCKDKGIDELLAAMKSVHEKYPSVRLYIGGIYEDEGYREKVEKCKDFVTFLGWIRDKEKEKYLERCGILVLPSYYEGFPVSIIEAMYNETAVVACNVGGIPDIIDDGVDGLLVPPRNVLDLQKAIIRLLEDKNLTNLLGVNGRKKVVNNYSVEENINRLVQIYQRNYKNFKKS